MSLFSDATAGKHERAIILGPNTTRNTSTDKPQRSTDKLQTCADKSQRSTARPQTSTDKLSKPGRPQTSPRQALLILLLLAPPPLLSPPLLPLQQSMHTYSHVCSLGLCGCCSALEGRGPAPPILWAQTDPSLNSSLPHSVFTIHGTGWGGRVDVGGREEGNTIAIRRDDNI